jgi:hypothetical protein
MSNIPDQPEGTCTHRLQARITKKYISANDSGDNSKGNVNLLVTSNVVPRIWDCTKSAILEDMKTQSYVEQKLLAMGTGAPTINAESAENADGVKPRSASRMTK